MNLISDRIYLRLLKESDAQIFLNATQDQEIRYMTGTKCSFTLEQIHKHISNIKKDTSRYDFAVCLNGTNQMIGELSIFDIDEENRKAGFRISMAATGLTGKGFGSEATRLVLKFVFKELRLNRLQLEVFSHNLRAIRAYEKAGFIREGVLREALFYDDVYSDEIIMSIIESDYMKQTE
ncbi:MULTISPECIES: GNAT family N-acetyltransferase [unclassified Exiguobacterium]|uniref:GNAT family N-acetyltransferase n=2 Tax=Exiguobacterium TaxID=33986 RepID=UPI0008D42307|nr:MULTISPECIES: GNAT family protein [unclassified Exiguobacterium]OGX79249.1 aminoglycoside adenylyltransferase [Exiguobacterium sp. SH31]TCI59115.1 N-acetyltransferase [Exiguobacterium sp. SH0S2]